VKRFLGTALLIAAAACTKKQVAPTVQTATVTRRDIIIDAQANGIIEPIAIIEVKSKAGGVITRMPVETGTRVNPGDLIAQIDTRDVQNNFDQAKASLDAAQARLTLAESDRKRNEELFKARVITPQEFENTSVNFETAKSNVITAQTQLDIRKQALEEATVKAPAEGTIIDKTVSEGTIVAGANNSVSGGTTIVKMADLGTVRVRALFNESDIGNIHPGQAANVTVDAYPDRRFQGVVEKIEPQAVVQQNVTMFPVLVNLDNGEALLRPGMNGQINVLIDEHDGVIAVPNDAIKNTREAVATGAMLGLSADSVTKEMTAQGVNLTGGNRGGFGPGAGGGGRRGGNGGGARNGGGGATGTAGGEVAPVVQQGGGGQGGFGGPQASDADCKKIDDILKGHAAEKKQLDALVAKMTALRPAGFGGGNNRGGQTGAGGQGRQAGGDSTRRRGGGDSTQRRGGGGGGGRGMSPEMQAINEEMRAIYTKLNIDQRTAGACRRRAMGGNAQAAGGNRQAGTQGGGRGGQLTPGSEMTQRPQRTRQGLVFVSDSAKVNFHPRVVRLGQGNLDFTEVVDGLKEGERVVMLGALALQAQRQQQQDRMRQNANPLGGGQTPGGPGGGPGGGGPGGGNPGGGGGGRGGRGG
jgi:HlyD family secretion protein